MSANQTRLRRLAAFAGYAALGPITGPLVAGVVRNLKGGAPILAGLYVLAWVMIYAELTALTGWLAARAIGA